MVYYIVRCSLAPFDYQSSNWPINFDCRRGIFTRLIEDGHLNLPPLRKWLFLSYLKNQFELVIYLIFKIFHENGHSQNSIYDEIHFRWIFKNPRNRPRVIICVIFPQKWKFWNFFEFSLPFAHYIDVNNQKYGIPIIFFEPAL